MKIAIIGTGISGLSVANMLNKTHEVLLFEANDKIGGLIKCERINDVLFHQVGGHVFNSKNSQVLEWFWSHFDRDSEFISTKRNAKVFINGKLIGYPIENYFYHLDNDIVKAITSEILQLSRFDVKSPLEYPNFEQFLKCNFGETLYKIYFGPYNSKIWKTDLSTVSMAWLEGKLPMPNYREILVSNILRQEESEMVHSMFYYPKENGSQFIVDRLSKNLNIVKNTRVNSIKCGLDGKYTIEGIEGFDKVIYCGDIRKLPLQVLQILKDSGQVDIEQFDGLRSNGTSNILCETDDTDISWLYIPESFTRAHRVIFTGNFSPSNNRGSKRKTCVVEFSGKVSYDEMCNEIQKLPGNLRPLAFNYEPNSYVIQDVTTRPFISSVKKVLEEKSIYLLGRFAEWEYYNMDKCIEAAFELEYRINNSSSAILN